MTILKIILTVDTIRSYDILVYLCHNANILHHSSVDMERVNPVPKGKQAKMTLRIKFRISGPDVQIASYERLQMICPPSIGERPKAGLNGGFWIELRDKKDHVLFHRVLSNPLGNSVEVHSPDGKIQRVFGVAKESSFEVLLPDYAEAKTIIFLGESLESVTGKEGKISTAHELARFNIPNKLGDGQMQARGKNQ